MDGCVELADSISSYFEQVADSYESNPLEMSSFVLNIFDLWRLLDMYCCKLSPLLLDHHPIFSAEILDCLQLPDSEDVLRLQIIQNHMRQRNEIAFLPDILSPCDSRECFPYRVFDCFPNMSDVEESILEQSKNNRQKKKEEWERQITEWERLAEITNTIEFCSCPYGKNNRFSQDDIERHTVCRRCRAFRKRSALKILIHEDSLPTAKPFHRAAIVFELQLPRCLELYREATWSIIRDLAHPIWSKMAKTDAPKLLLSDFRQLNSFSPSVSTSRALTLASRKKSFLQTHYEAKQVSRESCESIVLGFGPEFHLYDFDRKIWVENFDRTALTLEHLCGVHIPIPLQCVIPCQPHPPTVVTGPSSYQLLANQTLCPQEVSLHEFSACQKLLFGSSQRWANIVVELGSANLNFSSAETVEMLKGLAFKAGPTSNHTHGIRQAFKVFEDPAFCDRLAGQIKTRLESIRANWRENKCMSLLVVLSECLINLKNFPAGRELIQSIRKTTLDWIRNLREEMVGTQDKNTTDSSALVEYSFTAAILCRRTFASETQILSAADLSIYCEASMALHPNTPASLIESREIRDMMIHDIKMGHRLERGICHALQQHPRSFHLAVMQAWPFSKKFKFSTCCFDSSEHGWVSATLEIQGSHFTSSHVVHFNYLRGFLLLDSKPLSGLPMKIRNSEVVKSLFGTKIHLATIVSNRHGMSHQLINPHEGNEVHFGIRHAGTPDESVVVQLSSSHGTVEFVPREMFKRDGHYDLPERLCKKPCMHFLNFATGCLEVRRYPQLWRLRPRDWVINLRTRTCQKGTIHQISRLLSHESNLGRKMVHSFQHFERPEGLLLYVPSSGRPHVELSRFEMTFFVNYNGRLQDNKLNMEFDKDQDAGTFYGLLSKIVLRDVKNQSKRSIIVPFGQPESRICGPHLEILMVSEFDTVRFGKFDIDVNLGRLETPPEPALVFAKAYYHALTAFPIPDPLTSKTGMEEAFHILQSGVAQPWQPFGVLPLQYLDMIAQLSPKRQFYPEDQRRLQSVQWNPYMLVTTQHDHLDALVHNLIQRSQQLRVFQDNQDTIVPCQPRSILRKRGEHERVLYEPNSLHPLFHCASDRTYRSRCATKSSDPAQDVAAITHCLFARPFRLLAPIDLRTILRQQEVIGGLEKDIKFFCSLSKLFEGDIFGQWGQLVRHCIDENASQPYKVAFHLALLAFHGLQDMHQVLAAFACVEALKNLQLPCHPAFTGVEINAPEVEKLTNLIKTVSPEFVPSQKCRLVASARQRHDNQCEAESKLLATYFINQWPAGTIVLTKDMPRTELIGCQEALECVSETWDKLHHNRELGLFVESAQHALDQITLPQLTNYISSVPDHNIKSQSLTARLIFTPRKRSPLPDLGKDLLSKSTLPIQPSQPIISPRELVVQLSNNGHGSLRIKPSPAYDRQKLRDILVCFAESTNPIRKGYGEDLLNSLTALEKVGGAFKEIRQLKDSLRSRPWLQNHIRRVEGLIKDQKDLIVGRLAMVDNRYEWLRSGDLWPGTATTTILEQLRSSLGLEFGIGMKEALVDLGLLITLKQWLGRVHHAKLHGNSQMTEEILHNTGHENWKPIDHPDWLLMEIEASILIRPRQVEVAHQIISPASRQNSLTQLMMGEGKWN